MNLGPLELLVLLAVLLLVVGPTVLPRITRNLGRSVGSFRRGLQEGKRAEEAIRGTLEREEPRVGTGEPDGGPPQPPRDEGGERGSPGPGG